MIKFGLSWVAKLLAKALVAHFFTQKIPNLELTQNSG